MADKLLPCPFCGGDAEFHDTSATWVRCEDCGAEIECQVEKKDAALAWNRRTPSRLRVSPLTITQIETLANNILNVNEYAYTVECLAHHLSDGDQAPLPRGEIDGIQ